TRTRDNSVNEVSQTTAAGSDTLQGEIKQIALRGRKITDQPMQVWWLPERKVLVYYADNCESIDPQTRFFVHLYIHSLRSFKTEDFRSLKSDTRKNGHCLYKLDLSSFNVKKIHTGQYIPQKGIVWATALRQDSIPSIVQGITKQGQKIADQPMQVWWLPDRKILAYYTEHCSSVDLKKRFFVHVYSGQSEQFKSLGFKFLKDGGVESSGYCLFEFPLPDDSPIQKIVTGQYVPKK